MRFNQGTVVVSLRDIELGAGVTLPEGTQGIVSGEGVQLVPYQQVLDAFMNRLPVGPLSRFGGWEDWEEVP